MATLLIINARHTNRSLCDSILVKAVEDFRKRIKNYEEVYEPITDRNLHYVKLIDMWVLHVCVCVYVCVCNLNCVKLFDVWVVRVCMRV